MPDSKRSSFLTMPAPPNRGTIILAGDTNSNTVKGPNNTLIACRDVTVVGEGNTLIGCYGIRVEGDNRLFFNNLETVLTDD